LYTIVLWPAVAIVVATALADLLAWAWHHRPVRASALIGVVVGMALLGVVREGGRAWLTDYQEASNASSYAGTADQLAHVLPADAPVLGHERWWWALHERPYLALNGLNERWMAARRDGRPVSFGELVSSTPTRFILLDGAGRGELNRYPAQLASEMDAFLQRSTVLHAQYDDRTYGHFDIYRITIVEAVNIVDRDQQSSGTRKPAGRR
jgi:hypothetical protein